MVEFRIGDQLPHAQRLAPDDRIYVNRNLRMPSIRAIGFDLDHTLAHYRGPEVEDLAHRLTRRRLVEQFGYPRELLEIPYDRSFVIRGLAIDKKRGNTLKMDYHNYVARGYHGFRPLRQEERKAAYRSGRIRMSSDAYVSVDTLFHLPEVHLYVALVDLKGQGKHGRRKRSYASIYDDVREAIDSIHGDGTFKSEVTADLGRYVRRDPRLVATLDEFRRVGKKLFLLTNSEYYYTDALLQYVIGGDKNQGRDWHDLFDLIVTDAGKPDFFTMLDRDWTPAPLESERSGRTIYHGGNARLLEATLGYRGDQIIYFGDHTYGDILRSKKSLGWRTAMVVEELADELATTVRLQPMLEELEHWKALRGVLEAETSVVEFEIRRLERKLEKSNGDGAARKRRRARLEEARKELRAGEKELREVSRRTTELGERVNTEYNAHWGPLFREGPETSRFGHQVKDFACLYMVRVSNFFHYSMNHYFRSAAERMPHELE